MSIRQLAMYPMVIEKIARKWKAVRDLAVCVPPETVDVQSEVQKRAADLCEKAEAIRKKSGQILRLLEAHHGNQFEENPIPVVEGSVFDIFDHIRVLAIMTVAMPAARAEWMFASKRIIRATWRVEAVVSMQVLSGKDPPEGDALALLCQDSTAEDALAEQLQLGTFNVMSQESHHERPAGGRAQESEISEKFKQIRELAVGSRYVEDAAELWASAECIRTLSNEILQLLDHECDECEKVEDYANEGVVARIFGDIWDSARGILSSEAVSECITLTAHAKWVQDCSRRILSATRRIEELLGPGRAMEVLSSADPEAAFFLPAQGHTDEAGTVTHPTALPHGPAPFDTWSHLDEEPAGLVEPGGDGADIIARQDLEYKLLELKNKYPSKRHPEIATVLHALGQAWNEAGSFQEAKQHFEEALQINCSLHVNKCLPETASQLLALGQLHLRTAVISEAKLYLKASLRVSMSLFGAKGHRTIALALLELGRLNLQARNLTQAQDQLEKSLEMTHCFFGGSDHPDAAAALLALGQWHLQEQDFTQAKHKLQKCLKIMQSLFGDKGHPDAAAALLALGQLHLQERGITLSK